MRVAIYSRVSTGHQVEHHTIEQQLGRLAEHVQAHAVEGWSLDPTHVFRDDGYSGAALARPGLDRLRDAVKGREIDRVLVTAPDRLARNYIHQMVLLEEWARAGCAAEFLDRPMSDDPHDHLLLQIRGAVAEYERTLIAERMRRGRLAKLRAGVLLPWTRPPYGYRVNPDRPRELQGVTTDLAEAAVVAELFALYREPGTSLTQLALHLDARGVSTPTGTPCWSSPTIRGILHNPTYTGQVYAQRTRFRAPTHRRSAMHPIGRPGSTAVPLPAESWLLVGPVPALVSQVHFDEVQAKLATNRSFARRNNTVNQYLLRSLVSCGCCGLACMGRANKQYLYYMCNGKKRYTYSHRTTRCPARHTPADQLDALVWQDLCTLLAEPEPLAAAVARAHGGDALQGAVDRHRGAVRRAARAVAHGTNAGQEAVAPASHSTKETRLRADRCAQRKARYEELHRLRLSGLSAEAIAPALGMSATVARRWLRAGGPPAHSKPRQPQPMDAHVATLERRWHEGCRNASRLWRELRLQGFTGSRGPVARWVARQRREDPPPQAAEVQRAATWPAPSSRRCARLLIMAPDKLDAQEAVFLGHLAEMAPDLARAGALATGFAALVRNAPDESNGPALEAWLASTRGTALDAFVRGIDRDRDAVLAALVEPWSTGPVEGQINRLKTIKRQMYGRAGYDLLRKRVLAV